jgi:hypothetical protein
MCYINFGPAILIRVFLQLRYTDPPTHRTTYSLLASMYTPNLRLTFVTSYALRTSHYGPAINEKR